MTVGERISLRRKSIGITQNELAKRCGVTRATTNHYEKDLREPTLLNAMCIAQVLGVSLDFLARGDRNA